jgi:hypothetical protein
MATLKGQNFRILLLDNTAAKFKCIGKSTNCSVNLTGNTEDASTKDDVSLASKPEIVTKSWSVSVESLDVTDAAALLTAVKNMTKVTVMFDEVSTADNQTPTEANYQRIGYAYINDVTFTWNDRESATKSLQLSGTGELTHDASVPFEEIETDDDYTKGQFVRLFIGNELNPSKVLAAAKSLSMHVSETLEDSTTKDIDGFWVAQESTGISYDISTNALVRSGDTITSSVQDQNFNSLLNMWENRLPVNWQIANVSGANNRTKGSVICSREAVITSLTVNAQNRQSARYDATFNGYGIYTVAA